MSTAYDRRRARREFERERALGGESLAALHARENAKAPTTAEIFAKNRADTAVCPWTPDMFIEAGRLPRKAVKVLQRRCGVKA